MMKIRCWRNFEDGTVTGGGELLVALIKSFPGLFVDE
jgi:hypothetical protein